MPLIHYTACPVCQSAEIDPALQAVDHTVSHESFCNLAMPAMHVAVYAGCADAASIGAYYRSETYISHSNTSKGIVNQLYHQVRKKTPFGQVPVDRFHDPEENRGSYWILEPGRVHLSVLCNRKAGR